MEQDPTCLNRQTYDRIAGRFAAHTARMDERLVEMASRMAQLVQPGERLLDLGCGPGRDLGLFRASGIQAFGADLSRGMLNEARRVVGSGLCQMEMRRLGFAGHSFGAVWCNAALLHLPKQALPQALQEIARVLAPSGSLFLSVQKGSGEGLETNPSDETVRFFARYEAQEMQRYLEQAGFLIQRQTEYEHGRTWLWYETTWIGAG